MKKEADLYSKIDQLDMSIEQLEHRLNDHLKFHSRFFYCPECGKQTLGQPKYSGNVERDSSPDLLRCTQCSKVFKHDYRLIDCYIEDK